MSGLDPKLASMAVIAEATDPVVKFLDDKFKEISSGEDRMVNLIGGLYASAACLMARADLCIELTRGGIPTDVELTRQHIDSMRSMFRNLVRKTKADEIAAVERQAMKLNPWFEDDEKGGTAE